MTVSNTAQVLEFVYSLLMGIILGTAYVATHWFGKMRIVMDVVFSLFALGAATVFFLTVCSGLVRIYQLAAIVLGMLFVIRLFRVVFVRKGNGQKQNKVKTKKT